MNSVMTANFVHTISYKQICSNKNQPKVFFHKGLIFINPIPPSAVYTHLTISTHKTSQVKEKCNTKKGMAEIK